LHENAMTNRWPQPVQRLNRVSRQVFLQAATAVCAMAQARLAAARRGVPAVVAPGCLDRATFGPPETVPDRFRGRSFYRHSPQVTLMRTTAAECRELGRIVAQKLNATVGPVCVEIPARAISVISAAAGPFAARCAHQLLALLTR
jgi:uncharacterized protein (UPF0261 family)